MKKIIKLTIVTMLMCSLTACGEKKEEAKTTQVITTQVATEVASEQTTEKKTESTTEATTMERKPEETDAIINENVVVPGNPANSDEPIAGTTPDSGKTADYSVGVNEDAATVEAFAAKAKDAYLSADWNTLSGMINYPITMSPDVKVNNADEFLNYMSDKVVSEGDKKEMEAESCTNMFANGQGVCLGSGSIWLGDDVTTGKLGIIAVSGLETE